jgi:hypothetical protein
MINDICIESCEEKADCLYVGREYLGVGVYKNSVLALATSDRQRCGCIHARRAKQKEVYHSR